MDKLSELYQKGVSRRNFLVGAGALGAASVVTGCSNSGSYAAPTTPPITQFTDVDYLNFALNLEYLEAEFYLRAATGSGLSAADTGGTGTVTGGTKVPNLTAGQQAILNEIAYDEQQHVRFLRAALGTAAVTRPNIDLTNSFAGAAAAANAMSIATPGSPLIPSTFSPFSDFNAFLVGSFVFEDVGVTAYSGAAPLISSGGIAAGLLAAAAGILAVEAYHAAYVRTALTGIAIASGATPTNAAPYPYVAFANRISALRGALGGGNETPLAIPTTTSTPSSIVAADTTNAIAFHRNTDQVLHIVYGTYSNNTSSMTPAAGVAQGGFFPNGMNGNIKVTLS